MTVIIEEIEAIKKEHDDLRKSLPAFAKNLPQVKKADDLISRLIIIVEGVNHGKA